jgi:hypothetical protein
MIIAFPLEIVTPNKRYDPVGRCIYCGSMIGRLSDEHIVPFGIAGNAIVLPRASCRTCATATSKVEQICLQSMLGNLRVKLGSPTRRPKERPTALPLQRGEFDPVSKIVKPTQIALLPKEDFPFLYPAVRYPKPGALIGRDPKRDVEIEVQIITAEDELKNRIGGHGKALLGDPIHPFEFARMIAKICHAYAIAELGIDSFRPFLPHVILGTIPNQIGHALHFVGCTDDRPPPTPDLLFFQYHKWTMSTGRRFLAVTFRLFPCFDTPVYQAIVGSLDGGLP